MLKQSKQKSELKPNYSEVRLPGIQVRLKQGRGLTHRKEIADLDKSHRTVTKQLDHYTHQSNVFHRDSRISQKKKTVPMGKLHMRPFQWYLKTHWKYPQSSGHSNIMLRDFEKPSELVWRDPNNVLIGCPLHAEEHDLLLLTDASVKGWGAHLENLTVSGIWSDTEANLHKHSGIESNVLSNKVFSNPCSEQEGSGGLRQCHSSVLSQQAWGGTHS